MKTPYTKTELLYLASAFAVLALGVAYGIRVHDFHGLHKVGALIIILGLVFASKDFSELVASRMTKMAPLQREFAFVSAVDAKEEAHKKVLSSDERRSLRAKVNKDFDKHLNETLHSSKTRSKFVEGYIVIIGTAVEAFGADFMHYLAG
ncbi:MAG: hypothetical protein NTZ15_17055 [Burkholderiales bacterium]|nr:hypothetical protein [Burkholderiales bacterium]